MLENPEEFNILLEKAINSIDSNTNKIYNKSKHSDGVSAAVV